MLTRRSAFALSLSLSLPAVAAENRRAKYPEIRFAVIPSENDDSVSARWAPLLTFLSDELGVKFMLRPATDYAAVIEGQRNGHIETAYHGSAAFARALMSGVRTEAFAVNVNKVSGRGYFSVFWVLAKSPHQRIEDLKGKNLGLVDPNSTSGYQVPPFHVGQDGYRSGEVLRPVGVHRQPRERHHGSGPGHGGCRSQFLFVGKILQPDA